MWIEACAFPHKAPGRHTCTTETNSSLTFHLLYGRKWIRLVKAEGRPTMSSVIYSQTRRGVIQKLKSCFRCIVPPLPHSPEMLEVFCICMFVFVLQKKTIASLKLSRTECQSQDKKGRDIIETHNNTNTNIFLFVPPLRE